MPTEVLSFFYGPVTAHCFNHNRTQVALCPNNNEVQIYEKSGSEWRLAHTLVGHDKIVTSIDWAPNSNRIVTASQDRNAYVWNYDAPSTSWKPTLVLLRINRAATFVRWSPLENKFAVASGARCIAICHFEEQNDWWVSKHLKRPIRSTVLSLDWHPNNVLLVTGCADMKVRVFSAYIKGLDEKPAPSVWGERLPFNTLCAEYVNGTGGWIHACAFSPDGQTIAWVAHDSSITVVDPSKSETPQTLRLPLLPLISLIWVSPSNIIAVGHDCTPVLFNYTPATGLKMVEKLDSGQKKAVAQSAMGSALNKFRQMDSRAQSEQAGTEIQTIHQNTITSVRFYEGARESVRKFSTSGVDGKLVIWDAASLESAFSGLRIS